MANKLLRLKKVQEATGKSRAGIYMDIAAGTFPKQIPIGDRQVAWIESEVQEWIDQRVQEARGQRPLAGKIA